MRGALVATLRALLQRGNEFLNLPAAEAALTARGSVGIEVAHVRPATDRAERDAKGSGGL